MDSNDVWDWWKGEDGKKTQTQTREQSREEDDLKGYISKMMRQQGRNQGDALPLPRGIIFYIVAIMALSIAVEVLTWSIATMFIAADDAIPVFDSRYIVTWLFVTGRLYSGLAGISLLVDWVVKFVGLSLLGGMFTAARRLLVLFALCGATMAINFAWSFVWSTTRLLPSPLSFSYVSTLIISAIFAFILAFCIQIGYSLSRGSLRAERLLPWNWITRVKSNTSIPPSLTAKPQVSNKKLQSIFDMVFREEGASVESTANDIRRELQTGALVGGESQISKGREYVVGLVRVLREQSLSADERALGEKVLGELEDSLRPLGYALKKQ